MRTVTARWSSRLGQSLLLAALLTACTADRSVGTTQKEAGTLALKVANLLPAGVTTVQALIQEASPTAPVRIVVLTIASSRELSIGSAGVLPGLVYFSVEARSASGGLIMQSFTDTVTVPPGASADVYPVMICLSVLCEGTAGVGVTAISPTPEVEPNGSAANATILPGFSVGAGTVSVGNGRVGLPTDQDHFAFTIVQRSRVNIVLYARRADPANTLDAEVTLFDANGNIVDANDDCGSPLSPDACIPPTAPLPAGTYVLRVRSSGFASTGRYTLTIQSAPTLLNLLYADDFTSGLGNWNEFGGGIWTGTGGEVIGDYNISCGGPSCPQADLVLSDAYQPGNANWRMEVESGLVQAYCCFQGGAWVNLAKFGLWVSPSSKEAYEVGWQWYPLNALQPTADSVYSFPQSYPWSTAGATFAHVPRFGSSGWQRAALERKADSLFMFFNDQLVARWRSVLPVSPKVGLHTYGKVRMRKFRLYSLP